MKKIICAQSVLHAKEIFSAMGDVSIIQDSEINHNSLLDANALIIRSQTRITSNLLQNTPINFVGTATSGTDHMDLAYLTNNHIAFADAKGVNANAVAEHVFLSLLIWANDHKISLTDMTIGIIGYGHVGKRLHQLLENITSNILLSDQPLYDAGRLDAHVPLNAIAKKADVISLHIPLEKTGRYQTQQLINQDFFNRCQKTPLLINTARGDVVDYDALLKAIKAKQISNFIADVWPSEPAINFAYIKAAYIATPHIAGHSKLAKIMGSYVISQALAAHWCVKPQLQVSQLKQQLGQVPLIATHTNKNLQTQIAQILLPLHAIDDISKQMKTWTQDKATFMQNYQAARAQASERYEFNQAFLPQALIDGKLKTILLKLGCINHA